MTFGAINPVIYPAIATVIAAAFTGGGVLFWRATNSQLQANAALATAQAHKTDEERDGIAATNADKLIGLMEGVMDKQNTRFEAEVGRMKVQVEQMALVSIRDSQTISDLRVLVEEERTSHELAMAEERKRCDRAMEELHLRIDLLSKQVQANSLGITNLEHAAPLDGIAAGTPVIITPVHPEGAPE